MDIKGFRPKAFAVDPHCKDAKRQWLHWYRSFTTYLLRLGEVSDADKLTLLVNHVDAVGYELISEATIYDEAVNTLQEVNAKPPNPVLARYLLKSCKQQLEETLEQYVQKLERLRTDCSFLAVSASRHKEEVIRDAFISGIVSNEIKRRLLEENNLSLDNTISKVRSLEAGHRNAELFSACSPQCAFVQQTAAVASSLENDNCKSDEG